MWRKKLRKRGTEKHTRVNARIKWEGISLLRKKNKRSLSVIKGHKSCWSRVRHRDFSKDMRAEGIISCVVNVCTVRTQGFNAFWSLIPVLLCFVSHVTLLFSYVSRAWLALKVHFEASCSCRTHIFHFQLCRSFLLFSKTVEGTYLLSTHLSLWISVGGFHLKKHLAAGKVIRVGHKLWRRWKSEI